MDDQIFFNRMALLASLVLVGCFAVSYAGAALGQNGSASPAAPSGPGYLYLTIQLNPQTGMPQYSPANFSVPRGEVIVSIADFDAPVAWSGCTCNVTGTVGSSERVNGTATQELSPANVAHTFTIPKLGINVLSPGGSTVVFTVYFNQTGEFDWFCMDPCGADGATGAPMGTAGYMQGVVTVSP